MARRWRRTSLSTRCGIGGRGQSYLWLRRRRRTSCSDRNDDIYIYLSKRKLKHGDVEMCITSSHMNSLIISQLLKPLFTNMVSQKLSRTPHHFLNIKWTTTACQRLTIQGSEATEDSSFSSCPCWLFRSRYKKLLIKANPFCFYSRLREIII